jgi:flavorubredoxin
VILRNITSDVFYVGSIDWDRPMFDELVPLPDGTTYNSYLVKGSAKTALIDTVHPAKTGELLESLRRAGVQSLDYIISNHAEQDHSGSIPAVLNLYPNAQVVTNARCKGLLSDALGVPAEKFAEVADGDTLSLGNKTLRFMLMPWVHWPDTMATYLEEDRILFSCDFLGSHLATSELFAIDEAKVYAAAKRYYAEIMMPFRNHVQKHLERLKSVEIATIAPSHGPIHARPSFILDAYADWASDRVKPEVVIPYVSMYASTARMVGYLAAKLAEQGLGVRVFNMVRADLGEVAVTLVDASTIILAAPTVLGGPHPGIVGGAFMINALRPKAKFISFIGSYGWGGATAEQLKKMLASLKVEFLTPVMVKGVPKGDDYKLLDELVEAIRSRHPGLTKGLGIDGQKGSRAVAGG